MMNIAAMRSTAPRPVPANEPGHIMPETVANGDEHDRDTATLGRSQNDEFRGVQFRPARFVKRQTAAWRGLSGEVVRVPNQDSFESDYHGPCHLLVLYTQAARHRGESIVEGLPR